MSRHQPADLFRNLSVIHDTLVFLRGANLRTEVPSTAALTDMEQDRIDFSATVEISLSEKEELDALIPVGNRLLCLKSSALAMNTSMERYVSRLDALSPNGEPAYVRRWDGEARLLGNTAGRLQFVCEDGAGGHLPSL